jgi:hypothetical protein
MFKRRWRGDTKYRFVYSLYCGQIYVVYGEPYFWSWQFYSEFLLDRCNLTNVDVVGVAGLAFVLGDVKVKKYSLF